MHRLFFALWPDATLRRGIAEVAEAHPAIRAAGGRAEAADRYHLTVQFLGDFRALAPAMLDALGAAATDVAALPPFELLARPASDRSVPAVSCGWDARRHRRDSCKLHRDLGEALAAAGVASKEAPTFIPHVTLRRHARGPVEQAIPPLRWWARDFVLIDSTAGEYRIIGRWPLAGA